MSELALQYPLGRPIARAVAVRRQRHLPPGARVLVAAGNQVLPEQPIAEVGQSSGGTVVLAGLAGVIAEVVPSQHVAIEGVATLAQGIVGIGGAVVGPLVVLPRGESLAVVPIPRGGVILFPRHVPLTLLQRAAAGGAAGIIAASASARELEAFARADLTALLDGPAALSAQVALTVVLTEGLGMRPMDPSMYQALGQRIHDTVLLTGTTQPRDNVRPEVLLSLPLGTQAARATADAADAALIPGARALARGGARSGMSGVILHVFQRQQRTATGAFAAAASVRFDDGSVEIVPLAALDRTN
jgi:hypothetical protein